MEKNASVFIAGHKGMVGSAIVRRLQELGYTNLIYRTHSELDLRNQVKVDMFFAVEKPEYVFLAAAKVGGIQANISYPANYIYDNLMIETNVIHSAFEAEVKKLLFLGSCCMYPRNCPQPMKEKYLFDGKLEPTNEGYGLAKLAGMGLCQAYNKQYKCNFITIIPPNLYGIGDKYNEQSHLIGALIDKFHKAKINNIKSVVCWGSGNARRELMYVDDLINIIHFVMDNYDDNEPLNIGSGIDYSILELANIVSSIVGYNGEIIWDTTKPEGMPQKLMDSSKLKNIGWDKAFTDIKEGITISYKDYLSNNLF